MQCSVFFSAGILIYLQRAIRCVPFFIIISWRGLIKLYPVSTPWPLVSSRGARIGSLSMGCRRPQQRYIMGKPVVAVRMMYSSRNIEVLVWLISQILVFIQQFVYDTALRQDILSWLWCHMLLYISGCQNAWRNRLALTNSLFGRQKMKCHHPDKTIAQRRNRRWMKYFRSHTTNSTGPPSLKKSVSLTSEVLLAPPLHRASLLNLNNIKPNGPSEQHDSSNRVVFFFTYILVYSWYINHLRRVCQQIV